MLLLFSPKWDWDTFLGPMAIARMTTTVFSYTCWHSQDDIKAPHHAKNHEESVLRGLLPRVLTRLLTCLVSWSRWLTLARAQHALSLFTEQRWGWQTYHFLMLGLGCNRPGDCPSGRCCQLWRLSSADVSHLWPESCLITVRHATLESVWRGFTEQKRTVPTPGLSAQPFRALCNLGHTSGERLHSLPSQGLWCPATFALPTS